MGAVSSGHELRAATRVEVCADRTVTPVIEGRSFPLVDVNVPLMPEHLLDAARQALRVESWHPWYPGDAATLIPAAVAAGIDRLVVVPHASGPDQAQSINYWSANVQASYQPHVIAIATFHGEDRDLPALAEEAFASLGLHGASLISGDMLREGRLDAVLHAAVRYQVPIFLGTGNGSRMRTPADVDVIQRVLDRFPGITVIVASMGAGAFEAVFRLCETYPGLLVDTALVLNRFLGGPPPIARLIEFQDRVLFGSGFPLAPYRVETAINAVLDLHLGRTIEEKLFWTNAARVFGLAPPDLPGSPASDAHPHLSPKEPAPGKTLR